MVASQSRNFEELAAIFKGSDEHYLQQLHFSLEEELLSRRVGRVEIIPKCRAGLRPLMELEARRYEELFVPEGIDVYERFYRNATHFTSGAYDRDANRLEGHLSVGITTVDFYESICRSKVRDDDQDVWEPGKPPVLYINSFILDDPIWAVYLFRHMAGQLCEFMRINKLRITKAFAIGALDESTTMLERYGFVEVARYEGKYPVMLNNDITQGRLGRYFD